MENKYLFFDKTRINYKTYGSGKSVVLIHGFGEDSSIWDAQVAFLKNKYLLLVPDLPGTGESEMIGKENVSMSDYAEAIKAILTAEKIKETIMIGHSMGGYITLAFAEKYPALLTSLGLVHSGAYADDAAKKETRKKAIKFIDEHGSEAFLKTSIPGLFYDDKKNKKDIDRHIEKGALFFPGALIQYYNAMISRPDRTGILKNARMPVLFIIGEHDKAIPFTHSLQQSHLPHQAYIDILRNSAHMGMLEEAERTNEILAQFLQSLC